MQNTIKDYIKQEIESNDIVLFMKGDRNFPQCGFSSLVVNVLQSLGVKFNDINVLASNELREAIKVYSKWPTIPQLYIKGEFIGGCDIVKEMYKSNELQKLVENCAKL